jgi:glycogen(starch) synthase
MRILMLGWEFPPFISGGLGTACRGLTDAMGRLQARILFVLPKGGESPQGAEEFDEVDAREDARRIAHAPDKGAGGVPEVQLAPVPCELTNPYQTANPQPGEPAQHRDRADRPQNIAVEKPRPSSVRIIGVGGEDGYDGDLLGKIHSYADRCVDLTRRELFDVIHAHDWMTFPAAISIARFSGRPFVVHVHATEFDRSGEDINRTIYEIERQGMIAASRVIAVSERTRNIIIQRYGIPPEKVSVVHNGIDFDRPVERRRNGRNDERVVLFLGRITRQKGPEYFLRAAARVAERMDGVKFVIAGTGDQVPAVIKLAGDLGLEDRVTFTGFLRGAAVEEAYRNADVYAMPSVSEPFGLSALEAARCGVPVVMSKSSGAAEVLKRGALKVDFWDTEMMAKMIISILKYPALADMLRRESAAELKELTWQEAARKCIRFYYDALVRNSGPPRPSAVPAG